MARRKQVARSAVAADLATLVGLETDVLHVRWAELFGAKPIKRVSRELLIRGIAYRLQEEAEGGLAKKTLRHLDRLAKEFASSGTVKIDSVRDLRSGTRIVREWQGKVHEVIVLDDGYLWRGTRYRSLSEIARLITGTRCLVRASLGRWRGRTSQPRIVRLLPSSPDQRLRRGPQIRSTCSPEWRESPMGDRRRSVRCAVYTRKSSEEGLEQSFNSLHAQREACEAYVQSQKHEGWSVIRAQYDDGGFSGGTMERPSLKLLLDDIRSGWVDVVVVYKIDRLTRSLFDFAKIVEIFDAASESFVSVTQSFNTTTSMGRLTLNVLLSFAQFEREVTGERIRDKVAASKKKGMWMGGNVPLGYDLKERRLTVNEAEAKTVVTIFEQYTELGTVRKLKQAIDRLGLRTKVREKGIGDQQTATGGAPFTTGHLYTILNNPLYIGKVRHKEQIHPGEHAAIVADDLWNRVQARLAANAVKRAAGTGSKSPSLLVARIF
jgi:DNA invertase Pin-like site-specific DNA recombinase